MYPLLYSSIPLSTLPCGWLCVVPSCAWNRTVKVWAGGSFLGACLILTVGHDSDRRADKRVPGKRCGPSGHGTRADVGWWPCGWQKEGPEPEGLAVSDTTVRTWAYQHFGHLTFFHWGLTDKRQRLVTLKTIKHLRWNHFLQHFSFFLCHETIRWTHLEMLLGLEERDCMTLEACVPPIPGTNGEVLFFAIWCLLLEDSKERNIGQYQNTPLPLKRFKGSIFFH